MAPQAEPANETPEDDEHTSPSITAHETVPERLVFTELGNADGWIATDVTVEISE